MQILMREPGGGLLLASKYSRAPAAFGQVLVVCGEIISQEASSFRPLIDIVAARGTLPSPADAAATELLMLLRRR